MRSYTLISIKKRNTEFLLLLLILEYLKYCKLLYIYIYIYICFSLIVITILFNYNHHLDGVSHWWCYKNSLYLRMTILSDRIKDDHTFIFIFSSLEFTKLLVDNKLKNWHLQNSFFLIGFRDLSIIKLMNFYKGSQ